MVFPLSKKSRCRLLTKGCVQKLTGGKFLDGIYSTHTIPISCAPIHRGHDFILMRTWDPTGLVERGNVYCRIGIAGKLVLEHIPPTTILISYFDGKLSLASCPVNETCVSFEETFRP